MRGAGSVFLGGEATRERGGKKRFLVWEKRQPFFLGEATRFFLGEATRFFLGRGEGAFFFWSRQLGFFR